MFLLETCLAECQSCWILRCKSIHRTKLKHTHLWMSIIVKFPICSLFLDGFLYDILLDWRRRDLLRAKYRQLKVQYFLKRMLVRHVLPLFFPSHEQKMHSCFERRWNFIKMLPAPGSHWLQRHIAWICAISQPNKQSNGEFSRTRN